MTSSSEPALSRERGQAAAAAARARAVHLQLRRLEHERDDQRHQQGPGHHGPGRPGRDHALPAGHGRADDPRRQADRPYGRKRCFTVGLVVYGVGALISAAAPGLGVLILGNSILEGVGTALLIPPVYILTTLLFTQVTSRARAFGAISAAGRDRRRGRAADRRPHHAPRSAGGPRSCSRPLVVARDRAAEPAAARPAPGGPDAGRSTSAAPCCRRVGLILVVTGHPRRRQQPLADGRPARRRRARARLVLPARSGAKERAGKEPLLSTALFRNRMSNLGLVTQNVQWLLLHGHVVRRLRLPPGRARLRRDPDRRDLHRDDGRPAAVLARRPSGSRSGAPQRTLILAGFVVTIVGIGVLLALVTARRSPWAFAPGLFLIGLGLGGC